MLSAWMICRRTLYLAMLIVSLLFISSSSAQADSTLISAGSTWKYNAGGNDLGTGWRTVEYGDAAWASGPAQLGYGDGDEKTVISYGSSSTNKYPTYYFRYSFASSGPGSASALALRFLRDDGCVIYLNGVEVLRSNMPSGTIAFNTWASSAIGGTDESAWLQASIDPALLRAGSNIIAVEVHQSSASSSDVSFDLELLSTPPQAPPPSVTLISPADGSSGVSASPTLKALVSDPSGGSLDVTFSGRTDPAPSAFSIVVLPDTQHYSETFPDIFTAQTQWIANNVAFGNIAFVSHLGDIAEHASSTTEYQRANFSMSLLDGVLPYGMAPGNHDTPTTLYNQYFPYTRYAGASWYGGHLGSNNDNNYQLFTAGSIDFLAIHLEFCPSTAAISWADSILKSHPNRVAIITTHGYLGASGGRSVSGCSSTQYIWDGLALPNPNVYFMLCGHVHAEQRRSDIANAHPVHQILSDYQDLPSGGGGYLRILRFVPAEDKIYVQTYSPWLNQYQTDADSQFTLDFPMSGAQTIKTLTAVPSGSEVSASWPNLASNARYVWKVTVKNSAGVTFNGTQWAFTTGTMTANAAPTANSQAISATEDTPVLFVLSASDPEGNPLSYSIVTGPTKGSLSRTLPNLKYQPNANFYGSDSFTFKANDGQIDSNVAIVNISVIPVNDAPVAGSDTYSLTQGSTLNVAAPGVLGNDSDVDGPTLSAVLVAGPANGSLNLNANGSFSYSPNAGFSGSDSFSYRASDSTATSNIATVSLTVAPLSGSPILSASFDTGQDGFTYYDDVFRGTRQPYYASGVRVTSGGYSGSALRVTLGGINNTLIAGMSGGWRRTFSLSAAAPLILSFRYNLSQSPDYESDERSQVVATVDGTLYGVSPADYVAQVAGNGDGGSNITTGWKLVQLPLGTLGAGAHTLTLGGYNNKKNSVSESTTVLIDNVVIAGQ
jgi:hypothetical protein